MQHRFRLCLDISLSRPFQPPFGGNATEHGQRDACSEPPPPQTESLSTRHDRFMTAIPVAVIDDDTGVRTGLERTLRQLGYEPQLFESAVQFRDTADPANYKAILLDFMMPQMHGIELLEHFARNGVDTPVIMMSDQGDVVTGHTAARLGSVEWMPKPIRSLQLDGALKAAVRAGEERREQHKPQSTATPEELACLERITEAEQKVLLLMTTQNASGRDKSSKEIARELGISPRTVQSHRASIVKKLDTHSRIAMRDLLHAAGKLWRG
jgi:FixJ family two-component response regulator